MIHQIVLDGTATSLNETLNELTYVAKISGLKSKLRKTLRLYG